MRTNYNKVLGLGALLLGLQATALASPILVVSNGILTGAQGIEFGGGQYDVTFSDVRPDNDDFMFGNYQQTYAASQALDQFVFQGVYDSTPNLTRGCSSWAACFVVTPYAVNWLAVTGAAFSNTESRILDATLAYSVLGNAANQSSVTYAHWSRQEVRQAVPEPSTLLLAGAGLAALAVRRKFRGKPAA